MTRRISLAVFVAGIVATNLNAAELLTTSTLHLSNKSYMQGRLISSDDPKVLRWQSDYFTHAFEFPMTAVNTVHYPLSKQQIKPTGEYCFELVGGDVVYGNLVGLSGTTVSVADRRIGKVEIQRSHIRRFYRWQGSELIYLGPNGLEGWKVTSAKPQWRDEGGMPATDNAGDSLFGDFGLPEKAVIEFELSWTKKPDFLFALGVNENTSTVQQAFRFAVWDNDLVVIGESMQDADVASLQQVSAGSGQIRVQAYLDQKNQTMQVFSRRGDPLAKLKVHGKKPQILSGLRLTNKKGNIRLERLRISRWNGVELKAVRTDRARLHRNDGTVLYGQLTQYDAESKKFTVKDGDKSTQVEEAAIADVFLSPNAIPDAPESSPESSITAKLRVVYQDGTRLTGVVQKIDETHVSIKSDAMPTQLRLPLDGLRSLAAISRTNAAAPPKSGRSGRLELNDLRMRGHLIGGTDQPNQSCLVWKPELSNNASPLKHGVAGRIVYREPKPKPKKKVVRTIRPAQVKRPQGFGDIFKKMLTGSVPVQPKSAAGGMRSMHLRSGDTIPCDIATITEDGIKFKTSLSDATFVKHEKVKSVELSVTGGAPKLAKTKRERLLTLPRMLKNAPPTHLICAKNGDFLRGRIIGMNDKSIQVEVRLENREVPRDRVSQIIWLHADELGDEEAIAAAGDLANITRVQTLRSNGNRLTFEATKFEGSTLSGKSEILGACRSDISKVDQLLFGPYIERAAARLAYHRWKLHHATEPKFVQASEGEGGDSPPITGTQSPLVGKAAPDFELELLDGKKYQLSENKGKIIILDFWATWCGPCLQTMPLVDEITREFANKGVELVAVNMEEQRPQIKSMLERHKLKMPVVMDIDGVVASKYAVTAIPQTVVIDQEGKVARLFVGGGPKLGEPLRAALRELTGEKVETPSE